MNHHQKINFMEKTSSTGIDVDEDDDDND